MANTSTIHIKTDFDCKVYDYDKEIGSTIADTFCNFELRKGEHELTFVYLEDESISKTITYKVEDADCDYQLIIEIAEIICNKAEEQYISTNYSYAFALYSLAAEKGIFKAQFRLGCCYECGLGVEQDIFKALEWFTEAAEQGYAEAQSNLGYCYRNGIGVEKDLTKAVEWYTKAAEQDVMDAQSALGEMYYFSNDYEKSVGWNSKAAEHNYVNASAQLYLGLCYEFGKGVEKDLVKAVGWYSKAAEHGFALGYAVSAKFNLGLCYEYGKGVEKDLVMAVEWYSKAAKQGHAGAQYHLGLCYGKGEGVEKDLGKALEWLSKAAEKEHCNAQYMLGQCYYYGEGMEEDHKKAVEWYSKAADNNCIEAQYQLGVCYKDGTGVQKDLTKALEWYSKAAEQGNALAQCQLGYCYECGTGVDKDFTIAVRWYTKAAEQGDADAQFDLGLCYEFGKGIDADKTKATEWYTKAVEQGHDKAKARLEEINQNKKSTIYYLFFDTETTGLFVDEKQSFDLHHSFFKHDLRFQMMRQPHMVQLSWITTDKDCNIISQHDYIIQPKGFSIPSEATRIHGITTEIAKEKGAPIKEVIEKFMEDVYAANTLVGHNIAFDRRVINTELIRLRLNNEYDDTNSYDFDSKESICTMKESIQYCEIPSHNYYHPYKQPKLQELHKKLFGYEFEDAHNSMSDVTATLKCFKEMKKLGWI